MKRIWWWWSWWWWAKCFLYETKLSSCFSV